jgi:aldehyde:ferredoxin oxidoreductase
MKRDMSVLPELVGKILRVNLSTGRWTVENIDLFLIKMFMGGIGLAAKILFEETGPDVDPLSSENVVIISAGLLNGTGAPTAYRTEITTKSPLTGIVGSGNFGGVFGSNLRKAGYEAIVLTGKSRNPVSLIIDEGHVELKSARHLWGKDTWETTDIMKEEIGKDFSVMAIGQAGENLVRFACPIIDHYHAAGRSHAGCVMGSKKLKAVAVRGTRKIPIAFLEKFQEVSNEIEKKIRDYPERGLRQEVGSIHKVVDSAKKGCLQARNYQSGIVPESNDLWRPEDFKKYLVKGPIYCGQCSLSHHYGCHVTANVKEGKYKGLSMEGISFSLLIWEWASKCAIESLPAMMKCKEMCNRLGMDEVGPIPMALELHQRGIITEQDLGGKELKWGDAEGILEMISNIAHRRGMGDLFAEGSVGAAKSIGRGSEKYAMTIKGMEMLACPDPRSGGMAKNLGNITCLRGGDDLKNAHTIFEKVPDWATNQGIKEEEYAKWFLERLDMIDEVKNRIYGTPPNLDSSTYTPERIALMTQWYEDLSFVRDSLGICLFAVNTTSAIGSALSAKLLSAYLGVDFTPQEVMEAGERITNVLKAYNVREGASRSKDNFPERFFSEPLQKESTQGASLSRNEIDKLLDAYYELRRWDKETGNPTRGTLEKLGLESVAGDLAKRGYV